MKVKNMKSSRGNAVPNQFIIENGMPLFKTKRMKKGRRLSCGTTFQSYDSIIAHKCSDGCVFLDGYYWDYSTTTGKYRNQFLNEGIAETRKKIESGEYKLVNLNY